MSRKKGGRSSVKSKRLGVGGMASSQVMPYLVPWILNVLLLPAALLTHWQWSGDGVMIAVLAFSLAGLALLTHSAWGKRHRTSQVLATLYVSVAGAWLVFATAAGPLEKPLLNAWLAGFALAIGWDLKMAGMSSDDDKAGDRGDPLFDRIRSLKGARTKSVKETDGRLEAKVQMVPGEGTPADVQAEKARIASALSMDPNDVTIQQVAGRGDQVKMAFTSGDGTRVSQVWTGPSAPGKSITAAPLVPGMRADGRPVELWIVGDPRPPQPRNLPHTLLTGMTGSGKTDTHATICIDMRWRTDAVPIVLDASGKFEQGFGLIKPILGAFVKTEEQVRQVVRNFPAAARYRAELLGSLERPDGTFGYAQWEPECFTRHGIPLLWIGMEESADFAGSLNDDLDEGVRKFRSGGVALCNSLQTATFTNLDRKTRGQFANSLTHGMKEMADAKFAMNADTISAGADPTKWGADSPGSMYAEVVGTPRPEWSVDARAFYLDRAAKIKEVNALLEIQDQWARIDKGTFDVLFAGVFDTQAPAVSGSEAPTVEVPVQSEPEAQEVFSPVVLTEEGAVDVSQPLPPMKFPDTVFALGNPGAREGMSPEEAMRTMEARIDELEADGTLAVSFQDVSDLTALTGRGRAWIYKALHKLVDSGRLEQRDGKPPFTIRPRVTAGVTPLSR